MSETRPAAAPEEAPEVTTGYHLPQRTKMLILGGAMLAMFLSSMEQTVVSTALPRIAADLNPQDAFTALLFHESVEEAYSGTAGAFRSGALAAWTPSGGTRLASTSPL